MAMSRTPLNNMLRDQGRMSNSDILLPTSASEPAVQMLDDVNCDGIFTDDPTATGPFANYIAYLSSNQPGLHDEGSHEYQVWGSNSDPDQHQHYPSLIPNIDEQLQRIQSPNFSGKSGGARDFIGDLLDSTSLTTAHAQPTKRSSPIQYPRRQNHSCDQCRSSKKACDLPLTVRISRRTPSTSCSTCNNRGLSCTVVWLASKKLKGHAKKRASMVSYVAEPDGTSAEEQPTDRLRSDILENISTVESDLSRQLNAREISLQYFNLYIDVCDMPLSACLLQGSMPPQCGLGIAALAPLSASQNLAIYMKRANAWINSCWGTSPDSDLWSSNTAAPHTFRTVALLDAIFQYRDYKKPPHIASSLRATSTNDTYRWVAIATAAQFTVATNQSSSYSRDLAIVTWRKARDMVFKNIAVTDSFRQSLSMTLFGLIIRPNISPEEDYISETDSLYSLCEGIRRLDSLCAKASSYLQSNKENCPYPRGDFTWELEPDIIKNLFELVGAIQRLSNFTNDMVVVTSQGDICPIPNKAIYLSPRSPHRSMCSFQPPDIATSVAADKDETSIISRARTKGQTLMALERSNGSYDDVEQAVGDSVPLHILLWRALTPFMLATKSVQTGQADYTAIASRYEAIMNLVALWRSSFGIFDRKSIKCLQQSPTKIRRIFAFCVNDCDLGVLLFYDTVQSLEKDLAEKPLTPEKNILCNTLHATRSSLKSQRLISALQISTLASICGRGSSPGFQENGGLKNYIQDIVARPVSSKLPRLRLLFSGC